MGADFSAIFSHRLNDGSVFKFCDDLNEYSLFPNLKSYLLNLAGETDESITTWQVKRGSNLWRIYGPNGFCIIVGKKTCQLQHYIKWLSFVLNDLEINIQSNLHEICIELARYLKSEQIIYVPEGMLTASGAGDFVYTGEDVNSILTWLNSKCGKPTSNIHEIFDVNNDQLNPCGYYIHIV